MFVETNKSIAIALNNSDFEHQDQIRHYNTGY